MGFNHIQTWGIYQLVNYYLPVSHYNWQLKVIGHWQIKKFDPGLIVAIMVC